MGLSQLQQIKNNNKKNKTGKRTNRRHEYKKKSHFFSFFKPQCFTVQEIKTFLSSAFDR